MLAAMSALAYTSTAVGSLLLNAWQRGARRADVEALTREIDQLGRRRGEDVVVLMVIPENTSLPDDSAREAVGTMLRGGGLSEVVVVIEGRGFGASAMRSVFAGLGLIYRPGFSWTVKAQVEDALDWLEGQRGSLDRSAVLEAHRELRDATQV